MGVLSQIVPHRAETLAGDRSCHSAIDLRDPNFLYYLQSRFSNAAEERLHVVYCDERRRYLFDETHVIGGKHSLRVRARPLVHQAMQVGARGLILAHNHLSGVCRPSDEDIMATQRLQELGSALELRLIDHLIFTRQRVFSMMAGGLL